jgi:hypothetical protein
MFAMLRKSVLGVAIVLVSFGCGGGASPTSPSSDPSSGGALNVRITDSPFGAAKAVLVTFSEVSVQKGSDWSKLPFPDSSASTWTCDLKKLENNAQDLIASGAPSAGEYTWVRLVVQSARVYLQNSAQSATPCARTIAAPAGESYNMNIARTEGKDNGSFVVSGSKATTITVDFDGDSSVAENGTNNYILTPVVRVVSVQ